MEANGQVHPLAAMLARVEPETLGGTFGNVQGTAQGDTLADIVAKVKNKTFGDTLGNVKAQGLVDKLI